MTKIRRAIKLTSLSLILLFLITFCATLIAVINAQSKTPQSGRDVIIVLGAGLNGAEVSLILKYRLDKALEYYAENPGAVIAVSGGQGKNELIPEAAAMKAYLIANGVEPEKILTEDCSSSTKENFLFTKDILDEYFGGTDYSVMFVTSDFHVFRSGLYAKKAGFNAESLASPTVRHLIPSLYLREYAALMYYYVFESWR